MAKENAVLSEDGKHYKNFNIHDITANLYGYNKKDIVNLEMKISDNQTRPELNDVSMVADYWGCDDFEKK